MCLCVYISVYLCVCVSLSVCVYLSVCVLYMCLVHAQASTAVPRYAGPCRNHSRFGVFSFLAISIVTMTQGLTLISTMAQETPELEAFNFGYVWGKGLETLCTSAVPPSPWRITSLDWMFYVDAGGFNSDPHTCTVSAHTH